MDKITYRHISVPRVGFFLDIYVNDKRIVSKGCKDYLTLKRMISDIKIQLGGYNV